MPGQIALDRLLVVADPWASMLVDGEKTWELRTTGTSVRGLIGIALKGTGTVIGCAELVAVHGPFTRLQLAEFTHLTRVPSHSPYTGPKGLYAWEIAHARRFIRPLAYRHPRGAVIWVRLDPALPVP